MKSIKFTNANIYDSEAQEFFPGSIEIRDGRFAYVGHTPDGFGGIDLKGRCIIPAMVDVHTHGRCGIDFCGATAEQLPALRRDYARSGTATVIPTLASATLDEWVQTAETVHAVGFDALHLEGRWLAPSRRGAHAPELLALPDRTELDKVAKAAGNMHIHLSFAPELAHGMDFITYARSLGMTVGLAHSAATYEQALEAVRRGITSFTHTFNAMGGVTHRDPGAALAALTEGRYAEFICDGVHVHPGVIKLAYGAVPHDRFVLITDSLMAAGLGDGQYTLAGQNVTVKDGVARTDDGAIAGSMLSLYEAVRNLMQFVDIPLTQALPHATAVPAKMLGLDGVTGSIKENLRADFCILQEDGLSIDKVYAAGVEVQ